MRTMKRTVSCFRRLNGGNTAQPVFLRNVSSTRVKAEGRNEAADVDQLQLWENARNGNRLYMCVCQHFIMHGHAPNSQGRANEFPRSGPIVLERSSICLFLIASSLVYISALLCIPAPTKTSAAHVLQKCSPDATNFLYKSRPEYLYSILRDTGHFVANPQSRHNNNNNNNNSKQCIFTFPYTLVVTD